MNKEKTERTSGLAIAGLVIAILAILGSWVPILNNVSFFFAIVSLIFGVIGLVAIRKGKRVGQGLAVATIIISVLTLVVVISTQSFFSKVADEVSDSVDESISDLDGTNTDKLLETSVDVSLGEFTHDTGEDAEYTYDDTTKLPVKIKNKASEKASYTVKIEAVDNEGTRIAEDTVYVSDLNPGQSVSEDAFQYVEDGKLEALKTATFKILEVSK
ncbi:MAG: DUF4190 domain-containing protein [Bacteroidia bacterium]|nr:DUF4190 domain-containing protein [Bacteroidia bacterium]